MNIEKRMVVLTDTHCGHKVGMTPPEWQWKKSDDEERNTFAKIQKVMWNWVEKKTLEIKQEKPVDIVNCLGDMLDGKGYLSGSNEQVTTDFEEQIKMSSRVIDLFGGNKHYFVSGTPYHTGKVQDFEQWLAERYNTNCYKQVNLKFGGKLFNLRHHIGSSGIPHGRGTALLKELMWNLYKVGADLEEKYDYILRGHVHYFMEVANSEHRAFTLPAMQGEGSDFGLAKCTGMVNFGFMVFDLMEDGTIKHKVEMARIKVPTVKTIEV